MIDVVAVGEILVDLIATGKDDVTLFDAPAFVPLPGGAPANVAVGVKRLGKSSAFIGKVGNDDFGRGLRRLLLAEGVDVRALLTDTQHFTTLAFALLSASGVPHFDFCIGAHIHLEITDLDHSLLQTARIVHAGSVTMTQDPARTATFAAWEIAHEAGAICTYDINWRPLLWPDVAKGRSIVQRPLQLVDLVKMNEAELLLLTGEKDPRKGLLALETTAVLAIVTLGAQGCLYRFQGVLYEQQAPPATQVIDTTGAGDAFMAAILAGLSDHPAHLDLETVAAIIKQATKAGTLAVAKPGAIPSLPYAHELS